MPYWFGGAADLLKLTGVEASHVLIALPDDLGHAGNFRPRQRRGAGQCDAGQHRQVAGRDVEHSGEVGQKAGGQRRAQQ